MGIAAGGILINPRCGLPALSGFFPDLHCHVGLRAAFERSSRPFRARPSDGFWRWHLIYTVGGGIYAPEAADLQPETPLLRLPMRSSTCSS